MLLRNVEAGNLDSCSFISDDVTNGYNFFYDWVTAHNGIFNRGVIISDYEYRMSVHHVLFPIPEYAIMENCTGVINQTPGYITIKPRQEPRRVK